MGEEKRQASDRPQRGRGRPAGCRGGFEGGARGCLTLPSEAHRKSFLGQAAASDRPQRGRGRPAARGCLMSPSEAHRKSFLGQAAACRDVCGRGPWVSNVAFGSPEKKLSEPTCGLCLASAGVMPTQ